MSHYTIGIPFQNVDMWAVCSPEDVELAIQHGIDGIVISNHGGRQLDGIPSTLDALRVCAPVAKGRIPITIDGGIRRGSDIFKALALGASYCFLGRIPIWGLAVCVHGLALQSFSLTETVRWTRGSRAGHQDPASRIEDHHGIGWVRTLY